jgi:hypothetical protein
MKKGSGPFFQKKGQESDIRHLFGEKGPDPFYGAP